MPTPTPDPEPVVEELRYLALGDSYTISESVAVSERWPVQLTRLIREQGVKISEPEIVARTGWTTTQLAAEINIRSAKGPFDIVTLMIGVNVKGGEKLYRQGGEKLYH